MQTSPTIEATDGKPGGQSPATEKRATGPKVNHIHLHAHGQPVAGACEHRVQISFDILMSQDVETEPERCLVAAAAEFDGSDVAAERRRINQTAARWEADRARGARTLEGLEAELVTTIRDGRDATEIEKRIPQVSADNAALDKRLELFRPQIAEVERQAIALANRIVNHIREERLAQYDAEQQAAFQELIASPALQRLLVAYRNWHGALHLHADGAIVVRRALEASLPRPPVSTTEPATTPFGGYGSEMYPPQDLDDVRRREAASHDAATQATLARLQQRERDAEEHNAVLAAQHGNK